MKLVPVLPFALVDRAGISPEDPICGYIADNNRGRRLPMLAGLVIFTGSTLMLCLGRTIWWLLGGRMLQGAAAAVVWSSGLALLTDSVGNDQIGAAIGWVTLGISIGLFLSPLLGGIVFNRSGFLSVFGIAFGLLFLDLLLRLCMEERRTVRDLCRVDGSNTQIELPGHVETSDGLMTGPSSQQDRSGTDGHNHAANKLASHLVVFTSRTCKLLASRRLSTALWGIFVQAAVMTSLDGVLPVYVKDTFGWNSIFAGLIFLPVIIPSGLEPYIGKLPSSQCYRAVGGFALGLPFLVLLRLVDYDSTRQIVLLVFLLLFIGIALSFVIPPLMVEMTLFLESVEAVCPGMGTKAHTHRRTGSSLIAHCRDPDASTRVCPDPQSTPPHRQKHSRPTTATPAVSRVLYVVQSAPKQVAVRIECEKCLGYRCEMNKVGLLRDSR
ncbi:hypothetical protein PG994_001714 [Apiospora phragmitis]|uniref:Major facilitator superfamily (MFS) profile domain-containing protein n=1 Tax=Apiospora phragmitis TaxID=2905665 RepID=A0ABR1WU76_9PEZI